MVTFVEETQKEKDDEVWKVNTTSKHSSEYYQRLNSATIESQNNNSGHQPKSGFIWWSSKKTQRSYTNVELEQYSTKTWRKE